MAEKLTYDAEPGTEVKVQSLTVTDNFITGFVDENGIVRDRRDAAFRAENYAVVGEKDGK